MLRRDELLSWLASLPPTDRDRAIEERLGLADTVSTAPGSDLVGYHASGVAPIVQMLLDVPVTTDDVLVDLGSGLGKVVLLSHLLAGVTARGVELQPELVARARETARRLGVDVRFDEGDARSGDLDDGTVFFLYLPFTGSALAAVLTRLEAIACRRPIVICALGLDLDRDAQWLTRRKSDRFWLAIYDSAPSVRRESSIAALRGIDAEALASDSI